MQRPSSLLAGIAGLTLLLAIAGRADVPAPPVNQLIGMDDVAFSMLTEADCRVCHTSGVPDRHHNLYGQTIPPGSVVPYPGAGPLYVCLSCHDENFTVVRDCTVCHTTSPHHSTAPAIAGDCVSCHGDIVDNMDDGHYIPTYTPSLVTPSPKGGAGLPLNSRGNGAGACNYCHDDDALTSPVILTTPDLHHNTGLMNCSWCHDVYGSVPMRVCEGCHGPDSLHNIQADSPNPNNIGTIVVGGEDAGYGHVGRDAGQSDSDCWGCHGFAFAAAPRSGPVIPSIGGLNVTAMKAGADTTLIVSGSGFTNTAGDLLFESSVKLTAADGTSLTLTPIMTLHDVMAVTIPGTTAPGNYDLQAVKAQFASNPAVISVMPEVVITEATADGTTVTIKGSGFGGYAAGSGTSVTATNTIVEGTIVSWSDTTVVAEFDSAPNDVTVNSVFGSDRFEVGGGGGSSSWAVRIPFVGAAEMQVTFSPYGGFLLVDERINGQSIFGVGVEQDKGMIFWFDNLGTVFYGIVDHDAATMQGIVINFQGVNSFWYAEQ